MCYNLLLTFPWICGEPVVGGTTDRFLSDSFATCLLVQTWDCLLPFSSPSVLPFVNSTWTFSFSASARVPQSIITAAFSFSNRTGSWINDFKLGTIFSALAVLCFSHLYGDTLPEKFLPTDSPLYLVTGHFYFFHFTTEWFWTWYLLIEYSYYFSHFFFWLLDPIRRVVTWDSFILPFSWVICDYASIAMSVKILIMPLK